MAVPVTVVTGFLGAGKTTLVNGWLAAERRGDVAMIVNEYGELGIDAELLAGRGRTLLEITGGCVCCTTHAELVRALDQLAATSPRRILIETSGAASPAGVLRAVQRGGFEQAFLLDGVITAVDATRAWALSANDLALEQIGYADVVVVTRGDACVPGQLERALDWVALHNGAAARVVAARGAIEDIATLDDLLARRVELASPRAHAGAAASHVYESVSLSLEGEVDGERFAEFVETELAACAGRIFRTKGILAVAGVEARMIVQGVADAVEIDFGATWDETTRRSRLVIVGFGLDAAALRRGFAACAAPGGV